MAEYIERETTVKLLRRLESRDYRREKGSIQEAIKMVSFPEYTPAADVVEVVRCKYCKYFGLNDENVPYCLNPFGLDDPEPNGFCNYGIGKN